MLQQQNQKRAMEAFKNNLLVALVIAFACLRCGISGDPDILTDFIAPPNADGNFFTFTGLRSFVSNFTLPVNFSGNTVSMTEFPALNGQSVSFAVLQFPAGFINPPHTRPHATGLLFLVHGVLEVGFVDTENKLYTQRLETGDIFVFPKGLVHYQYNPIENDFAIAVVAFGTAGTGTVSVPVSLFTTGIDENVLAKSFKTDVATIEKIEAGLKPKA